MKQYRYEIQYLLYVANVVFFTRYIFHAKLVAYHFLTNLIYIISCSGPSAIQSSHTSSGHPASFQGPQPLTQHQMALPPGPQIPPPANNFSGLCAQSSLPNMARQDGIPGSGLPNPNLQQLPGQTPGPGYHPQQGKEGCLVSNWKQKMHWESLLELWTLKFGVLQT